MAVYQATKRHRHKGVHRRQSFGSALKAWFLLHAGRES